MRVPWTARRSNQLILNEINPEYSLEELLLKLKLQSFGHLLQRANSLEVNLSKLQEIAKGREAGMLQSMGSQRVRHDVLTEKQHEH